MLSTIGLALDLIGATILVVGLFGRSRPLTPGFARGPQDIARDAAFGVAGGSLLAGGFALQALSYLDVSIECSREATLLAAGMALVGACTYAYLAYGVTYLLVHRREARYVAEEWPDIEYRSRRRRRGLRFWAQERIT